MKSRLSARSQYPDRFPHSAPRSGPVQTDPIQRSALPAPPGAKRLHNGHHALDGSQRPRTVH